MLITRTVRIRDANDELTHVDVALCNVTFNTRVDFPVAYRGLNVSELAKRAKAVHVRDEGWLPATAGNVFAAIDYDID